MSIISDTMTTAQSSQTYQTSEASDSTSKKSKVSGKSIGNPQLSETASKYYDELKKKYSNMEFILVSEEQKESARAQAGNYAVANKIVVLIDEDKIERMAEDEEYRKQYENIIANAASGLSQMSSSLSSTGANIKGYGMQINDNGTASYFAVIDKSLSAQKERIERKAEEKKEAKKAAEKEEKLERLEKSRTDKSDSANSDNTVTVTAFSLEELVQKINGLIYDDMSDNVRTEEEKQVGQHIDYSV